MNKDSHLIFEAYKNTKPQSKSFKALFPVGTQVEYKQDPEHDDGDPKSPKNGKGIVVDDKLGYGFGEDEDNYWGIVELENGSIVEARISELTKTGFESDYIPNPATMNRVKKGTQFLTAGVSKLKKQIKKSGQ